MRSSVWAVLDLRYLLDMDWRQRGGGWKCETGTQARGLDGDFTVEIVDI